LRGPLGTSTSWQRDFPQWLKTREGIVGQSEAARLFNVGQGLYFDIAELDPA
jgi:hypothetical protein